MLVFDRIPEDECVGGPQDGGGCDTVRLPNRGCVVYPRLYEVCLLPLFVISHFSRVVYLSSDRIDSEGVAVGELNGGGNVLDDGLAQITRGHELS
jgi:hypothetical protein